MDFAVAVPASLVSDVPHLREKTSRLGMVGRAFAIFRVREVVVYPDRPGDDQHQEAELVATILRYMETPQYLRKHLFPLMPTLRYVGILPPLRTPHHPLTKRLVDLQHGEHREGVVVREGDDALVDVGVERPIPLKERNLHLGQRITVVILKDGARLQIQQVEPQRPDSYWGYRVRVSNLTLGRILTQGLFDQVLLTSRSGQPVTAAVQEFRHRWTEADTLFIVFGSPREGLTAILHREGIEIRDVDASVVNTIPGQGTETVRTEEALYATLAILNSLLEANSGHGS